MSVLCDLLQMAFVRVWFSIGWVWECLGYFCQFLAKKGESKSLLQGMCVLFLQLLCKDDEQDVLTSCLCFSFSLCLVI